MLRAKRLCQTLHSAFCTGTFADEQTKVSFALAGIRTIIPSTCKRSAGKRDNVGEVYELVHTRAEHDDLGGTLD